MTCIVRTVSYGLFHLAMITVILEVDLEEAISLSTDRAVHIFIFSQLAVLYKEMQASST